jgi:hypothetical protein
MRTSVTVRLYLLLSLFILVYSCKKKDAADNNPSTNPPAAVTPVGTPVGNPVSKNIGSAGGALVSPDGKLELTIPSGALSNTTSISIQPVTNEAPGGLGLSYHLMPDGTKFNKAVTLTYHYTDKDVNGTLPYLLYIAYQDSSFQWKADFKKRNVDTIAKTVSLGITHFSVWSIGDRLNMFARPDELHENETSQITVELSDPPQDVSNPDDLPPLPQSSRLADNAVSNWKVNGQLNGNSQNGTINGTGSSVSYKAPASVATNRTVQVSAELKYSIVVFNNGNAVSSVNKLILFTNITLLTNKFEFHLQIEYTKTFLNTVNSVYIDKADMDITVNNSNVTISNITNTIPSITPSSLSIGACTYTYLIGTIGVLNIKGGSGYVGTDPNNRKIFGVQLSETDCQEAGFDLSCPSSSGLSQHVNPFSIPAGYIGEIFILKDSAQTKTYDPNGQEKTIFKLTVR